MRCLLPAVLTTLVASSATAATFPQRDATYPWLPAERVTMGSIHGRLQDIAPPPGFERVDSGAWGEWLRRLPLLAPEQLVLLVDGTPRRAQGMHVRVVDMDVLPYQECADSILRLRAEFQQSRGERFAFSGMQFQRGSRGAFDAFLKRLFAYRGTLNLSADLPRPRMGGMQPGDVLVMGGSPGHAVLVLDVVQGRRGRKLMLGNGFMPAQQFHILKARNGSAWFDESDLATALHVPPGFRFTWSHWRRFPAT